MDSNLASLPSAAARAPGAGLVLVVGATGALGRPAVRPLRERRVAVRALSRHPGQATDPEHPIDLFRTKHRIEQALLASGLDAMILRPAAFMEHHVHYFDGAAVLATGKANLIGPGTKRRNFVAGADLAQFAVRALLDDPPPFRTLDIGEHDHAGNLEVATHYAREAGIAARASHLPVGVARAMSALVAPLHPCMARILHRLSLPDDAIDERFDGAAALEQRFGVPLKRLDAFIHERVAEHLARGADGR